MDEAARKELTVQMGYMFRNNPAFQFCFRAVREGWLGQVFEMHAVISKKSGEAEHPYPPAHDLAVHETVLRASGMPCTAPKR